MRLDHLLSMETMSCFHERLVVGIDRDGSRGTEAFVVQFSEIRDGSRGDPKRGPSLQGGVAQLGEHLPCKQGVMGSIPIISTTGENRKRKSDLTERIR